MPATPPDKFNRFLGSWKKQISTWSSNGLLLSGAKEALKLGGNPSSFQSLLSKWAKGDFRELPKIRTVAAAAINNANAAYAASTKTIYINSQWLEQANQATFTRILTEELGHFLDNKLNLSDTQGDEGKYLSRYLEQSGSLSLSEKNSLRATLDHSSATIGNQAIAIETSTPSTTIKIGEVTIVSDNILPIPTKVGDHIFSPQENPDLIFKNTNNTTLFIQLDQPISPSRELLLTGGVNPMGYPLIAVDAAAGKYKVENFEPDTGRRLFYLIEKGIGSLIGNCSGKYYAMDDSSWASLEPPLTYYNKAKINGKIYTNNISPLTLNTVTWTINDSNSGIPNQNSSKNPFYNNGYSWKVGSFSLSTDNGNTWKEFDGTNQEALNFAGEGSQTLQIRAYDVAGRQTTFTEEIFVDTIAPTTIISDLKITGENSLARSTSGYSILPGANYTISGKLSQPLSPLTSAQSTEHLVITGATNIQFTSPTEFTATLFRDFSQGTYGEQILTYVIDDAGNGSANITSLTIRNTSPVYGFFTSENLNKDGFFKGTNESNILQGFNGDDYIDGMDGNDQAYGGEGEDDLYGGDGKDMLYGEWEDDYLNGGEGSDKIYGGDNNDYLVGGGGNDILDGGAGNDILIGGDGRDTLIGGAGDDTYVLDDPFDIIDDRGLASDKDTVIIRYQISSYVLTGGVKNADISGNSSVTSLTGSTDNNLLIGNNSGDVISGLGGNDVIVGGSGNDIINGGTGFDVLDYSQTDQPISFSSVTGKASGLSIGQDAVMGMEGILSGSGDDILVGSSNRDVFSGGYGSDNIDGGAGGDLYIINQGVEHGVAEFKDTGSSGSDEIRFTSTTDGDTLSLFNGDTGIEKIVIGIGHELIADSKGTSKTNIDASSLANQISLLGNDGDNILTGTAFNDAIQGGDGHDQLIGRAGVDTIIGGGGQDTLNGGTGLDILTGGSGADSFTYATLTEALIGGTGSARTFELIKDFSIGSDILDAPGTTPRTMKNLASVASLTDAQLATILTTANFMANGSATFTHQSGTTLRTFVAINDASAGFAAANDAILEITGYSGTLANLIVT